MPTGEAIISHTPEYETGYRLGESTAPQIRAWLQEQVDRTVEIGAMDANSPVKSTHKITEALRGQAAGAGVHVANIMAYEQAMQTPVPR